MAAQQPIAFMSYVRFNDEHDNGRLTQFHRRLLLDMLSAM